MSILDKDYTAPELELWGERYFVRTDPYWNMPHDAYQSIRFDNFKPILNQMPNRNSGMAKIMKLVSAIIAVGTNVAGDLAEQTIKELAYVCRLMWPESHWMRVSMRNEYGIPVVHISATILDEGQMKLNDLFQVRCLGVGGSAFKRNKGNRTTAMRKVERLQNVMERDAIQFRHHILTASGMKFPIHEINIIEGNN